MSVWTKGTYTHKGVALLSKLTQGYSLKITKALAGTGYVNPDNLANQAAVTGVKQALSFGTASYPAAGTCKLPVFLSNKDVTTGYVAKQIGLYAYDPDVGEILYYIVQSAKGTEVPSVKDMPEYSATWNIYLRYGQADNVSVTVDPSHTVTPDMLAEVRAIAESGVSAAMQGKAVVCKNTAALPFAGLRLFGKSTQNGTPTPDAPVELVSVERPVVSVYGKNLCAESAFDTMSSNGAATTYDDSTHTITMNENANTQSGRYYPPLKNMVAGQPYTISFDIRGTSGKFVYCGWGSKNTKITLSDTFARYSCTLYATGNKEQVIFYTEKTASGGLAAGEYMQFSNVQIELGETATAYEPYKFVQTVETGKILHGIPVTSGGNYTDENGQQWICDEIDFARGVYIQRTKTVTYDGDEAWAKSGTYSYYTRATDSNGAQPMCNRLTERTSESQPYIRPGTTGDGVPAIIVSFGNGSANTAEEFKELLAQNPLTVLYALATPTESVLTLEELAAYGAMTAHNPVTTVTNDAGAWMEVDCINAQHEKAFLVATSGRTVESVEYPGCFYRIVNGVVEWVNPPMVKNVEYRTTERWNGLPVFAKQMQSAPLNGVAETNFAPLGGESGYVMDVRGMTSGGKIIPYATGENFIYMWTDGVTVYVKSSDKFAGETVAVWTKYVKANAATLFV